MKQNNVVEPSLDALRWRYTSAKQDVLVNPLSWLIEFARANIKKLPEWGGKFDYGWKDLADGIVIFSMPRMWSSILPQWASPIDLKYAPAKTEMVEIQSELRRGLNRLLEETEAPSWHIPNLSPSVMLIRFKNGQISRSYHSKAFRDRFLMAVTDLLQSKGGYIRKCPFCERIFRAIKRQAYCSSKCSQNVRTRRYREISTLPMVPWPIDSRVLNFIYEKPAGEYL